MQPRSVRGQHARAREGGAVLRLHPAVDMWDTNRVLSTVPLRLRSLLESITGVHFGWKLQISRSRSVGATVVVSYARLRVVSKSRCSKSSYPFVFFGVRIFRILGVCIVFSPQSHRFGGAGRQSGAPDLDLVLEDCSMAFMVLLLDCHGCYQHFCCFLIAPA